jgi:hypothetical protein
LPKKPRTPPPPRRPVQAPQRRTTRSDQTAADRRRLRLLVLFAASGLIALGVVIAVIALNTGGGSANAGVGTAMRTAGCTLKTERAKSRQHVTSLEAKIKYNTFPPSSGSHYYSPAPWDFYTSPVTPVQVVHNEEHGGVILWWGNKVPSSTIDQLHAFYLSSPNGMLGTPLASLGRKVAITAWTSPPSGLGQGHAAVCPTFNEKAFKTFRDAYRGRGPERYPLDSETPGA